MRDKQWYCVECDEYWDDDEVIPEYQMKMCPECGSECEEVR